MILTKPYFTIETDINNDIILNHIEKCARTCYKSESRHIQLRDNLIKMIIKNGHHSTLGHYLISVRIICDRNMSHEIESHRIAFYFREISSYYNYSKNKINKQLTFIIPCWCKNIMGGKYNNKNILLPSAPMDELCWFNTVMLLEKKYLDLIKIHRLKPEQAISILPNSLKTEIIIIATLREWRYIFQLRTSKEARPQMREIMIPLLNEFKNKIDIIFDDIKVDDESTNR